jgi:hypothetical protein
MYCIDDSAAIYVIVVKFRNTICPLHRSSTFIGGLRCQAIQTERVPCIAERTQKAVYIVICLWVSRTPRAQEMVNAQLIF